MGSTTPVTNTESDDRNQSMQLRPKQPSWTLRSEQKCEAPGMTFHSLYAVFASP